ncbi:MAG: PadR family transcriptional regulator [Gemmataceae bacterium]
MSIRHAILGLLVEGPRHGYGLKAAYEKELVPGSTLNIGQVYQALDRLEPEGLVTVEVVPQAERPDRKVYTVTEAGRRELENWLTTPSGRGLELRNETFLKLVLAVRLARVGLALTPLRILDAERRVCLEQLRELLDTQNRVEWDTAPLAARLLVELGIQRLNAFHQWLDRVEQLLGEPGGAS